MRKVHQFLIRKIWFWRFWTFMFLFSPLCFLGFFALLAYSQLCTRLGSLWWCLLLELALWACSSGGITFVTSGEQTWQPHNTATHFSSSFFKFRDSGSEKPELLALAGQPSLHGYDALMVYWVQRALRRHRRQKYGKTSFSPFLGFSVSSVF